MNATITGRVWVFGDSVDTDAMYPAFAMKLDVPEASKHVFYQLRPGWTDLLEPGDIVIAGKNFGVGSSRPVAALFRHLGVAALVAEEFNSLFFRNAINAGLPRSPCPVSPRCSATAIAAVSTSPPALTATRPPAPSVRPGRCHR